MIRRIQIDNFKSLDGFSLPPVGLPPLANFTCLIGANGSGKTSVLQALDFLCYFMRGNAHLWLEDRGWKKDRISSSFDSSPFEQFETVVSIQIDPSNEATWKVHYNLYRDECDDESVLINGVPLLVATGGNVEVRTGSGLSRLLDGVSLPGSSISILKIAEPPHPLGVLKKLFGEDLVTFELFSPDSLKRESQRNKNIGKRGENLAGFSANLEGQIQDRISEQMRVFYPNINRVYWNKNLSTQLFRLDADERFLREEVHLSQFSDGFTRILAIVTQVESSSVSNRVLLLDEIENGIHPELLEKLIEYLLGTDMQIIATTHSPMILNYLTDEQARESVHFLYRNSEGRSRSCRYFDLPTARKKLGILGPGEVYIDTSIEQLAIEAEEMERGASAQAGAVEQ
jgi:predicted ATP-binding protein involved in virulence